MSKKLIDVSHTVSDGLVTYKGLPAPIICDYLSREASREHYAEGTAFHIGKIEMVANTGTYVDAPFHRYADGKDLAELPLSSLVNLDCVVIRVPEGYGRSLHPDLLQNKNVEGKAVLFDTGDGTRPVHSTLLHHEIPIVEHLTGLYALPDNNFRFFAVPVKVKAFGTFPVHAFGIV